MNRERFTIDVTDTPAGLDRSPPEIRLRLLLKTCLRFFGLKATAYCWWPRKEEPKPAKKSEPGEQNFTGFTRKSPRAPASESGEAMA